MNLSEQLESFLTSESMAVVRLVKAEAERLGLPLYIVGGSVRDLLLGRLIKDLDFTVEGEAAVLAEALLRKYAGRVVFHQQERTIKFLYPSSIAVYGLPDLAAKGKAGSSSQTSEGL